MSRQAYTKYKPSGIEWLGEIPIHWGKSKVKYLAEYLNGYPFKPSDWNDQGKEIIRIQNLTDGETSRNYFQGELDERYLIRRGDILLSWSASLGVYVWNREDGWLNQHIFKVTPVPLMVERDFYLWLSNWFIVEQQKDAHGSTMQHLTKDTFGGFVVYIPPKPEQRAIAAFLDRETARIDTLIKKKLRQIELLQEKRAALVSHVVTKGLNPNAKMKDSGVEWLGEIPEHWKIYRAKVLFEEIDERSEAGEEELLSVSHITGVTRRSEKKVTMFMAESLEDYKKCNAGDLIINTMWAWMGAMGITVEAGIVSPSYNVYRPRFSNQKPIFYDYLFRTGRFIAEVICHSKGIWTSRLRLYPEEFFEIRLPCPPPEEQMEIVTAIQKETGNFDVLQRKIEQSIEQLREYRMALISAAVTGKIDVRKEVS